MKITIIHPTRHRPHQALATRLKWMTNAADPGNIEYLFSMDTDDDSMPDNVEGLRAPNMTAIEAINYGASVATGDLLIVVSDDFSSEPGWDKALLAEIGDRRDFVMKTRDGIQKTLITLPIMDRAYYERFGYVYFPGYQHMYADTEMTAVAHMTGKVLNSDLFFEHKHYTTGKTPMDAVNIKNDATYTLGEKLFLARKKLYFGIEGAIFTYESIQWQ